MQVAQQCRWRNEARLGGMQTGGPGIEGGACLRYAGALRLKSTYPMEWLLVLTRYTPNIGFDVVAGPICI